MTRNATATRTATGARWRRCLAVVVVALAGTGITSTPAHAQIDPMDFTVSPADAGGIVEGPRDRLLAMWDTAVATATTTLTADARSLRLALRGDRCGSVPPAAVISVDGVEMSHVVIGSSWSVTTTTVGGWFPEGTHEVSVHTRRIDGGCGTVKIVDAWFSPETSRAAPGSAWVHGTDFRAEPDGSGGVFRHGPDGAPAFVLWSTGSAVGQAWARGVEQVRVRARGDSCEGPARMEVRVDGRLVLDTEVTEDARVYEADGLGLVRYWNDALQTVAVHFPNDHRTDECDRNLKVEWALVTASR